MYSTHTISRKQNAPLCQIVPIVQLIPPQYYLKKKKKKSVCVCVCGVYLLFVYIFIYLQTSES